MKSTSMRRALTSAVRSLLLLLPVLTAAAGPALSATYFVDGACATSGTGATLTCGTTGPFKTISEGVGAMHAGDTLNIRGAHGAFDGTYLEYVGVWGTGSAHAGHALSCTAGSPCVVQGCPAASCGADETRRSPPWCSAPTGRISVAASGRARWSRTTTTMKSVPVSRADTYDPGIILQGSSWAAKAPMQYAGDSNAQPTAGFWSYNPSTHVIYVSPPGGANPNTTVWVPRSKGLLIVDGNASGDCPEGTCPANNYVTFRRLTLDGSRWTAMFLRPDWANHANGIQLDQIAIMNAPRFGILGALMVNPTFTNVTVSNIGRGVSNVPSGTGGGFGLRFFNLYGGTFTNIATSHMGSAGPIVDCPWCDAPWNSFSNQDDNGEGFQIKASNNVTVRNFVATDLSWGAFTIDASHDCVLDGFSISRSRYGVTTEEYTPDPGKGFTRTYNITIRNGRVDNVGFSDGACLLLGAMSTLGAGEYGVRVYNNNFSRCARAGVLFTIHNSSTGATAVNKVSLFNNSLWSSRTSVGYTGCQTARTVRATPSILLRESKWMPGSRR